MHNPRLTELARDYAHRINALTEVHEAEIKQLYLQFRQEYQCLKKKIEAQEGENGANSLTDYNAASPLD